LAKAFTWQRVAGQLADIYAHTLEVFHEPAAVRVIIPCYNLGHTLERAVKSALAQTYPAAEVIIVNNNSTDNTQAVAGELTKLPHVYYANCPEQGVAHARNHGIREALSRGKYICCLDADDAIEPGFLEACVKALEADRSVGVAYTRLRWIK